MVLPDSVFGGNHVAPARGDYPEPQCGLLPHMPRNSGLPGQRGAAARLGRLHLPTIGDSKRSVTRAMAFS
jgi:hypothetical protein